MARSPGRPPVNLRELRSRYLPADRVPPPRLLDQLALDPRPGARALYRTLRRRRDASREAELHRSALLHFERLLWKAGVRHVAGVDEVGVGPLAGPVVAAAVVLPPDVDLAGVDDSKKLDPASRERLAAEIHVRAVGVAIAEVGVEEIDRLNVYHAGLEAMRRAVLALPVRAQHVLTDARTVPGLEGVPQNAFDKGDGLNYSIACASIVAKVHRDRLMTELAAAHPGYGFERHKGYGTAEHLRAVRELGPSPVHRRSFPVLRELQGEAQPLFYELKEAIESAGSGDDLALLRARLREAAEILAETEARKLGVLLLRRQKRLVSRAGDR